MKHYAIILLLEEQKRERENNVTITALGAKREENYNLSVEFNVPSK